MAPELSRMRVYILKFKGLRWSLDFGIMIKEAETSQIFQIQIQEPDIDAEFGFHPPTDLCQ